jgi:hypothetical protein
MIYGLWLWKNNPTTNRLIEGITQEEQKAMDELFSDEAMARRQTEWVLYCKCTWANEEYRNWGIVSYANIDAAIAEKDEITAGGWYRFGDMTSLLGTLDMPGGVVQKPDFPDPIYQLYIIKSNPVTLANQLRLSQDELADGWQKWEESVRRHGACKMLVCKSGWCNEEMPAFGVMAFPNIEARMAHVEDLEKMNWGLYSQAFTLLGKAI